MHKAGEFMIGYRLMYARQSGDTLRGTGAVSDIALAEAGYSMKASSMNMHMQHARHHVRADRLVDPDGHAERDMTMTMEPRPMGAGVDVDRTDHGTHLTAPHGTDGVGDTG